MSAMEAPKLSCFSNSKKYFHAEYQVKITMVYMGALRTGYMRLVSSHFPMVIRPDVSRENPHGLKGGRRASYINTDALVE